MKTNYTKIIILISANTEWQIVKAEFPNCQMFTSPFGEWFQVELSQGQRALFFQSGWGKIQAAASTQYVIDQWQPELIINIGTCGGFKGSVEVGEVVLVNKTIVYDILEQMGDQVEAIDFFATVLDLSWLNEPYPIEVTINKMLSADRDIVPADIPGLKAQYNGIAADWESGAIAHIANNNHTRCLILRGVTDIVHKAGGEAYDNNLNLFKERAAMVMKKLISSLPDWMANIEELDI